MKNGFIICVLVLGIFSCTKKTDDVYTPMTASSIVNGVKVSIKDNSGNDLLSDENFLKNITIYGENSKQYSKFQRIEQNGKFLVYFAAELPDSKKMNLLVDNSEKIITEAYGTSVVKFKIGNQVLDLLCTFKYQNSFPNQPTMFGGTGIHLIKIECNGKVIEQDNHQMKLSIVYDNNKLTLNP